MRPYESSPGVRRLESGGSSPSGPTTGGRIRGLIHVLAGGLGVRRTL